MSNIKVESGWLLGAMIAFPNRTRRRGWSRRAGIRRGTERAVDRSTCQFVKRHAMLIKYPNYLMQSLDTIPSRENLSPNRQPYAMLARFLQGNIRPDAHGGAWLHLKANGAADADR